MHSLSVIITTFNEEHNIQGVLESVDWADEAIVVDSFSTDRTVEIARRYTRRVMQREYTGPASQKNWAIPQASHEWILLLDADERVTKKLKLEIQKYLNQENIPFDAFWIGRRNFFMGKEVRYSGWQGDAVVRFFRRDLCRYNDKQVHEEVITEGLRVGRLNQKLLHYTYRDMEHFLAKMRRYARWSAQDYDEKTGRVTGFHLLFKPLFRFLKHYFFQLGFLDGKVGLVVSSVMAWGVFLRYANLMERRRKA
ncbi:MAG: glycosyltransferase family 2 protein [Lewinellaceae bacterium]|nr:glycosyltransferase family 2 protein [Lewinellaceae bacterium]MCB9287545.1 glycosyltransferase family 2 protein [Lewinellaceae bacterium]